MNPENFFPAFHIGHADTDLTVKAAGTQQSRVQNIRTVCCGDDDDPGVFGKAVHFNEELIQGLLTFVMTTADTGAALAADSVDFINKHDTGRIFLRLFKEVTDTRRANTDEHFHKIRTADAKERHTGFTGNGFGKKGFPGTGVTVKENAFGNFRAQSVVARSVLQKIDDFRQLFLNFIHTGHIPEGHFFLAGSLHFRVALPELHHFSAAALALIHHIDKHGQNNHGGNQHNQNTLPPGFAGFLGEGNIHTFFIQLRNEIILGRNRRPIDVFIFIRRRDFPSVIRSNNHNLAVFTGEGVVHKFR